MPTLTPPHAPQRIAAALDFSSADAAVLSYAVMLAKASGRRAVVILLHVVESSGARLLGDEVHDQEAQADQARLELYTTELAEMGVEASYDLGFGQAADRLASLIGEHRADLVVVGSHGHRGMADFIHGTTVERLRHHVDVPVMAVPTGD